MNVHCKKIFGLFVKLIESMRIRIRIHGLLMQIRIPQNEPIRLDPDPQSCFEEFRVKTT